jgi:hypothetical protein
VLADPRSHYTGPCPFFWSTTTSISFYKYLKSAGSLCADKGKKAVTDLTRYRNLGEFISINTCFFNLNNFTFG